MQNKGPSLLQGLEPGAGSGGTAAVRQRNCAEDAPETVMLRRRMLQKCWGEAGRCSRNVGAEVGGCSRNGDAEARDAPKILGA